MTSTGKDTQTTVQGDSPEGIPAINLSPAAMVDNIADWPFNRVVDMLKRKEKEAGSNYRPGESHFSYRYGIKGLVPTIDELAARYGASRGRVFRWLTYHGIAIAREDAFIVKLTGIYSQVRRSALGDRGTDVLDILNSRLPYSPRNMSDTTGSIPLYEPWVKSDFQEKAMVCGVHDYSIAQLFILRSILTADFYGLDSIFREFESESERWDKWMQARLGFVSSLVEGDPFKKPTTPCRK